MAVIGSIAVNVLAAKLEKFERDMKRAERSVLGFSSKAQNAMRLVSTSIKGLVAGGVVGILTDQFIQAAEAIDRTAKTAAKLGAATESLIGLRFAGEQTGVAIGTMDMALQRMIRRIAEAAKGTGEAKAAIAELGLEAGVLDRLSMEDKFLQIADAIREVEGQSQKLRIAFKLFDSEGVNVVNTLNAGRTAIEAMIQKGKELEGFTTEQARRVEAFNDNLNVLKKSAMGARSHATIALAPAANLGIDASRVVFDSLFRAPFSAINKLNDAFTQSIHDKIAKESLPGDLKPGNIQRLTNRIQDALAIQAAIFDATTKNPLPNQGFFESNPVRQKAIEKAIQAATEREVNRNFTPRSTDPRPISGTPQRRFSSFREAQLSYAAEGLALQRANEEKERQARLRANPFPILSGAINPRANASALLGAGSVLGKIGSAIGADITEGANRAYNKFRFNYTPLQALEGLTGIPIRDIADGKYRGGGRSSNESTLGPLHAVKANSAAGFAALRRNLVDASKEDRKIKALESIEKNTRKKTTVTEVDL